MAEKTWHILHIVVLLFILSIPFHPCGLLRYTMFIPLILPVIWLIFKGCPLTKMHQNVGVNHGDEFVEGLLKKISPKATKADTNNFVTLLLLIIAYASVYRYYKLCPESKGRKSIK